MSTTLVAYVHGREMVVGDVIGYETRNDTFSGGPRNYVELDMGWDSSVIVATDYVRLVTEGPDCAICQEMGLCDAHYEEKYGAHYLTSEEWTGRTKGDDNIENWL